MAGHQKGVLIQKKCKSNGFELTLYRRPLINPLVLVLYQKFCTKSFEKNLHVVPSFFPTATDEKIEHDEPEISTTTSKRRAKVERKTSEKEWNGKHYRVERETELSGV